MRKAGKGKLRGKETMSEKGEEIKKILRKYCLQRERGGEKTTQNAEKA